MLKNERLNSEGLRKLNATLKPVKGESLAGYITRVCEANGYKSIRYIAEFIGMPYVSNGDLTNLANYSKELAVLFDLAENEIIAMGYRSFGAHNDLAIGFDGQIIKRSLLDLKRQKICPCCVGLGISHKQVFDLVFITHCPEHDLASVDKCPSCQEGLSWSHGNLRKCKCGFDLCDAEITEGSGIYAQNIEKGRGIEGK